MYSINVHMCYFTRIARTFCCAVFNVAARILAAMMVIPTVMARLVSLLHRIVARLIAHRYIQHQCAYVLFYSNRFPGHLFCCFQCCSQDFGGNDVILTVMARLVSLVSRIVAWMIAHWYV